jgi:hypothetical protein
MTAWERGPTKSVAHPVGSVVFICLNPRDAGDYILGGDWNLSIRSATRIIQQLTQRYPDLGFNFRIVAPGTRTHGNLLYPIDWYLVGPAIGYAHCSSLRVTNSRLQASDHVPVILEILSHIRRQWDQRGPSRDLPPRSHRIRTREAPGPALLNEGARRQSNDVAEIR